jgi:plastocyanin
LAAALTLLYHLAKSGPEATKWAGVNRILEKSKMGSIPKAAVAVFVGTEFDSLTGRGGKDGTPLRKTPWGDIAYQLGGKETFAVVEEHDRKFIEPKGDVIRAFLPKDKPCLILMDEIINYVSTYRKSGFHNSMYNFMQSLSETIRGLDNAILVVSIPASELEYTSDDCQDEQRFKKMLDRVGKAIMMSAEKETSEIIRRRLFEWAGLPDEARKTAFEFADWVNNHRQQLSSTFPIDNAKEAFETSYPFHPMLLSVFERKWATLQRFQRTRGILRLLALWVSRAYHDGYKGAHHDPLIGLGTAPLDDPMFRAAVFEQLGEEKLESPVTTDICGKKDSNAVRLDKEAVDAIKKSRLHQKVATSVFFESNGGQSGRTEATIPELRLDVAEPDLDIGNVETVLEALTDSCYYLMVEKNKYRFSTKENLNKRFADRSANIQPAKVKELVLSEIQNVFKKEEGVDIVFFPEKSSQIQDRAALTFVVLDPEVSMQDATETKGLIDKMTREYGNSGRTFKSALIWCIAESNNLLQSEARKVLAWEDIEDESEDLHLDEQQEHELKENIQKAKRDLKESVWRTYKNVLLLDKENNIRNIDFGLIHSSSFSGSLTMFILSRLQQNGDIEESVSPNFLVRNWPPAFVEWSTKSVRDAFFASPQFPKLLNHESIKSTIARGVAGGIIAYVGKTAGGSYKPFYFESNLEVSEIEISDEMYIIKAEEAKKHKEPPKLTSIVVNPSTVCVEPGKKVTFTVKGLDQHSREMAVKDAEWTATGGKIQKDGVFAAGSDEGQFTVTVSVGGFTDNTSVTISKAGKPFIPPGGPKTDLKKLCWSGAIPSQKWMNFYTKVVSRFASDKDLKITVTVETSRNVISDQKIEETKVALRELGINDDVRIE